MNLGGDSSLLFFEYPWMYLTHSLGLLGNNLSGYSPQVQFVPMLAILTVLKLLNLNVEGSILGLILCCSFTGVVKLVATLSGADDEETPPQAFLAGVIYVCAPIVAIIEWTTILPRVMWLALTPWLIVLIIRHQRKGGVRIPIVVGLLLAFAAPAITDIPGTLAAVIVIVFVLSAALLGGIFRLRPLRLAGLLALVVLTNVYWLGPYLDGLVVHSATFARAASSSTKQSAISLIHILSAQSSVSDALSLRASTNMALANDWIQLHLMNWSSTLVVIGAIPLVLFIISVVYLILKVVPLRQQLLLSAMVLISVICLFLVTARVGPNSASTMAYLVTHIPAFTAERNFWATWVPAYTLVFAITVSLWAAKLLNSLSYRVTKVLILTLSIALALYNLPFFLGAEFRLPFSSAVANTRVMDGLPSSFMSMLTRLETLPPGAVLTLPFNDADYTQVAAVQSDRTSGAYIGISPVFYLTGRVDYNGAQSFANGSGVQSAIDSSLQKGNIKALANAAAYVGVRYVLSDDGALRFPNNIAAPPTSTKLAIVETKRFLSRFTSEVIYRSGPYSIRLLDPSMVVPDAALVPFNSATLKSNYLLHLAQGSSPSNEYKSCHHGSVVVSSWTDSRISLVTRDVPSGCVLRIITPGGVSWQAKTVGLNSTALTLESTNAASIAFEVPQGIGKTSNIMITYAPRSILIESAIVSGVGILLVIALFNLRVSQFVTIWWRKGRKGENASGPTSSPGI